MRHPGGPAPHRRRRGGRADGVALRHGFRRVAPGVRRVGAGAHLVQQRGHLGDPAGVVRATP